MRIPLGILVGSTMLAIGHPLINDRIESAQTEADDE
jgi:hypothetical protein